ncbi:MAG: hypothetical protein RJB04_1080, partial [Verrucomicrobiota bacterium]
MLSADGLAGGLTTHGPTHDLDIAGAIEVFQDSQANPSDWMQGQVVEAPTEVLNDLFDGLLVEALVEEIGPVSEAAVPLADDAVLKDDEGLLGERVSGSSPKLSGAVQKSGTSVVLDGTAGSGTDNQTFTTGNTGSNLTIGLGFFVDYLVVGGGGSGGTPGGSDANENTWGTGGGGGGGVLTKTGFQVNPSSYAVTVGSGGVAPSYSSSSTSRGGNGGASSFNGDIALGGGGGGAGTKVASGVGANGATGGGGGGEGSASGGSALRDTGVQGYDGGDSMASSNNRGAGGGGGGAGGAGSNATSAVGGNGGIGFLSNISGSNVRYGGGGGGGAINTNFLGSETAGVGGTGGGGDGSTTGGAESGTSGVGGGGGGRGYGGVGGNGGSGVVIVAYAGSSAGTGGVVSTAGGKTIHKFTAVGSSSLDFGSLNLASRLGVTASGKITGSGGLIYNGPGQLTLSNSSNDYSGPTVVASGTLVVSGSIASTSGVTVKSGATLRLSASQHLKNITVEAGGTLLIDTGVSVTADQYSNANTAGAAVAPTVSSVALTTGSGMLGAWLNAGDTVSATVTLSSWVAASGSTSGSPTLGLDIGGSLSNATLETSGKKFVLSDRLVFKATVIDGDNDSNGIAVSANTLSANSGSFSGPMNQSVDLAHAPVSSNANFMVDTLPPESPLINLGAGVSDGASSAEATQASGVVSVVGESGSSLTVQFVGAGTVTQTVTGSLTAQAVVLTASNLTTLGNGSIRVVVTATDSAG